MTLVSLLPEALYRGVHYQCIGRPNPARGSARARPRHRRLQRFATCHSSGGGARPPGSLLFSSAWRGRGRRPPRIVFPQWPLPVLRGCEIFCRFRSFLCGRVARCQGPHRPRGSFLIRFFSIFFRSSSFFSVLGSADLVGRGDAQPSTPCSQAVALSPQPYEAIPHAQPSTL